MHTLQPDLIEGPLRDYVGALPIIAAVKRHQDLPRPEAAESLIGIVWLPREPHPKDIDGGSKIDRLEPGLLANDGMAAIRPHGQVRAHFEDTLWCRSAHAHHAAVFFHQAGDFGFHPQMELRV